LENARVISWCEANTTYATIYIREASGVTYFCYAYGDDNSWTEEILVQSNVSTARLGIQATVDECALDVHQTGGANDHVHIAWAWAAGGILYHSELVVPTAPNNNSNWTTWTNRYQRVDNNAGGIGYYAPSISVDSSGDPHIAYGHSSASESLMYNYGSGASHAFTPANELTLTASPTVAVNPSMVAVPEVGRDLYVFWDDGSAIAYRKCPNASNPLVIGSWSAQANALTFGSTVSTHSVSYWYDGGAPKAQIYIVGCDTGNVTKSNWYDEGNVNGWGGGWRGAVTEGPSTTKVQVTQVDANDFALVYWASGSSVGRFAFTDYGSSDFDCVTSTFYLFTNSNMDNCSTEFRGRENDNFSFGTLHIQSSSDIMFDLVRINATPTATSLDPDSGAKEDEEAIITLTWTFSDAGQAQTQWSIEVDEYGTGFASPIWSSGIQVGAGGTDDIPASTLAFNTHYEWRLKVWDDEKGDEYDPYSISAWVT
jgi:hypothetical protein